MMAVSKQIMRIAQIAGTDRLVTKASIIGAGWFLESLFDLLKCDWASSYPSTSFLMRREKMECPCRTIVTLAKIPRMNRLPAKALVKCHGWLAQAFAHCFHHSFGRRAFAIDIEMTDMGMLTFIREELQIFNAIVMTIAVDMMYYLLRKQRATQILCHNVTMLKHRMPIYTHINIRGFSLPWKQFC